jgi:hypothetical protein
MKKILIVVFIYFACVINGAAQPRAFDDIFPGMNAETKNAVFSDSGYIRSSQRASGFVIAGRNTGLDPEIINIVLNKNPGYLVESISIIPGDPGAVSLLDIYNALGNIRGLSGRLYNSYSRGQAVPLFEEATRIKSERQTSSIADPPAAGTLPRSETVYIRLKDVNFGNTYYRGDMALVGLNGLRYTMTNFRNMSYLFVPVIREGKFTAQLYFETLQEGVLVYSIAGADISDFIASRIHIDSAISKRLGVITSWANDGIIARSR